jgi:hypothetical protein
MKVKYVFTMIFISILLLGGSILSFTYPVLKWDIEGTLDVAWSNPKGVRFNDLSKGDTMTVTFDCTSDEIGVYLLSQEQADEFRSPAFYKDPLPPPEILLKEGSVELEIPKDGDWEVLFWNESFTTDKEIEYSIDTDFRKDRTISLVSGTSLLILALIPVTLILISRTRERKSHLK